ncbi:MAG: Smr/MutS family protein [Marinifilaceae bacterium]|nr:Smr/MutS family protein [Marinifilaceae bacterium]
MIYPHNFETKIGFDKIRNLIKNYCISSLGKELVDQIKFSNKYKTIKEFVNQTDEFRTIQLEEENFPIGNFIDIRGKLHKIKAEGSFLELEDIFSLRRSLESVNAILKFFKTKQEENKYPYLLKLTGNVIIYPFILDKIGNIITKNGRMKDNASPELAHIRNSILKKQSAISKRMQVLLSSAKKEGWVEEDANLSIRDGRIVIPIPSAYKRKLKGIVHDESATGKTSYVEPSEIVETNNEIRELEYAERREIIKILQNFTNIIREYLPDLFKAYSFMAKIDFIRAKARLALELNSFLPHINKKSESEWKDAFHPLLFLSLKNEGRDIVPLNMNLNSDNRIILISGPNAGGKSVCLKTVGLVQYMFQCGMLVSMSPNSVVGIYDSIFIDIGDEQSIENDLSTYSSHLVNMRNFIKHANEESLMLIDEFGTGTEPRLGGALAEAILDELNNKKIKGIVTTHYSSLKHFASETEGIENGAMLYDSHAMQPLFKLLVGEPGSSFAFEIAKKIGLPKEILKSAADKIGEEHIAFDKHLKDISRDKRYWESKRIQIKKNEKRLDELVQRYETDLKKSDKERKEILKTAKVQAEAILKDANKAVENTIRGIKEANAEKEKTKKLRKDFETAKEDIKNINIDEEDKIKRKIDKIRNRQNKKNNKTEKPSSKTKEQQSIVKKSIEKGDSVKVDNKTIGEVIEINNKTAIVAFGSLMSSVKLSRLTRISKSQVKKQEKKYNQTSALIQEKISKRKLNFKADIDLRGCRAEEAIERMISHIDEAIMLEVSEFRILHGTGNGILRTLLRQQLSSMNIVSRFLDEKVEFGGSGITIVKLDLG